MFQSVHPVTQWFKSSMILYKYSSPLCHEPSCGSPSPGRLPESRMLLYWRALLPIEMVLYNRSSRGYAFSLKKNSKNSLSDRYANAQQKFDLCKLLSRRGICQETLDEQHLGDLCHHFVCPGTSERQLQWRTSWPPHFWKIPWFGCFKAKFYDSFINHEINNGSLWLSRLFTCSSLQHMVVDHQGPWAQCQNELNSETSQVFSFATSLNGLI